jgi:hypothetical protein
MNLERLHMTQAVDTIKPDGSTPLYQAMCGRLILWCKWVWLFSPPIIQWHFFD